MNDSLSTKIAMGFAITAQAVFWAVFLAYCTAPIWMQHVIKAN